MKIFISLSGLPTSLSQSLLGNSISQMCDYYQDYSKTQVKQLNSIPGLLLSLSALLLSYFLDKLTKYVKLIIILDLTLYMIIGFLPYIFYYSYTATLILRIFLGLFAGINEPLTLFILQKLKQKEIVKDSFFGYRSSCMSFLSLITNIISGLVVDQVGFQNLFWFYLIPIVQLLIGIFINFKIIIEDTDKQEQTQIEQKQDQQETLQGDVQEIDIKQQNKLCTKNNIIKLLPVYFTAFIDQLSYYIIPSSTSILLQQMNVTDALYTGIATGLSQFFSGIASLFYQQLHKKLSYIKLQIISNILTSIFMVAFGYSYNYAMLLVMISLTSAIFGNTLPNYNSWSGSIHKSVTNMSIIVFCTFFSHFLTPYVYCFDDEKLNILMAGITQLVFGLDFNNEISFQIQQEENVVLEQFNNVQVQEEDTLYKQIDELQQRINSLIAERDSKIAAIDEQIKDIEDKINQL